MCCKNPAVWHESIAQEEEANSSRKKKTAEECYLVQPYLQLHPQKREGECKKRSGEPSCRRL